LIGQLVGAQQMLAGSFGKLGTAYTIDMRIIDANLIDYMHLEKSHPGLKRRLGYIGLQNHSTRVDYRNIRIEELE